MDKKAKTHKTFKLLLKVVLYIGIGILVFAFGYLVYSFCHDMQYYEETISRVYKVPQRLSRGDYDGDYVSALISARNVKISVFAIIISAIGSVLTFLAFLMQQQANEIHRNDIKNEHIISSYEKLMDMHRDCVNHISINDTIHGAASFHFMFYELKSIYILITDKYPFLKEDGFKDIAAYISMTFFIRGASGDANKDYIVVEPLKTKLVDLIDKIDFYAITKGFREINIQFANRIPPRGFIMYKYKNPAEYPQLPILYKGHLNRLSSYFKIFEAYISLEEEPSKDIELYRKLFPTQISVHESAILDFYFRYKTIEDGKQYKSDVINLLTEQAKHISTFNIDNPEFYEM